MTCKFRIGICTSMLAALGLAGCSNVVPLSSEFHPAILEDVEVQIIDANDFDRQQMVRLLAEYDILSRFDVEIRSRDNYDEALAEELENAKIKALAAGGRVLMYTRNSELVGVIKQDARYAGASNVTTMYVLQRKVTAPVAARVETPPEPPAQPADPVPDQRPEVRAQPAPVVRESPPEAPQLSVEQREIWSLEEAQWRHLSDRDIAEYMRLWHNDFAGWTSWSTVPIRKPDVRSSVERATLKSYELHVESVRVFGGVAVTDYVVRSSWVDNAGNAGGDHWERITHTWMRVGNTWQIVGGMSTPTKQP
ncbi:MAG: nuclear transport factor 2 family protein [Gemmatimonadales bacterium]